MTIMLPSSARRMSLRRYLSPNERMKNIYYIIITLLFLTSCQENGANKAKPEAPRLRYVEDIATNKVIDNPNFNTCNGENVLQYFNVGEGLDYEGGKRAILDKFKNKYEVPKRSKFSGLIRVRFIINCNGSSGRFRHLSMDYNYKEVEAPKNITDQLVSITKSLDNWNIKKYNDSPIDYYQYLSFKIENGKIVKILP
jgi:hypothetical protein